MILFLMPYIMQIVNIHKQAECDGLVSSIVVYKSAIMDRRTIFA